MIDGLGNISEYPAIMTVPEMAAFLRIGRNTAYTLVSSGDIPSVKIGRQLRVYREDVIASVFRSGAGIEKK